MLCRNCTGGKCSEELESIELECPGCRGLGCEHCSDGAFTIPECPSTYCQQIVPSIELFELWHQGIPPITGGSLDQSVWFVEAARVFKTEENLAKVAANG